MVGMRDGLFILSHSLLHRLMRYGANEAVSLQDAIEQILHEAEQNGQQIKDSDLYLYLPLPFDPVSLDYTKTREGVIFACALSGTASEEEEEEEEGRGRRSGYSYVVVLSLSTLISFALSQNSQLHSPIFLSLHRFHRPIRSIAFVSGASSPLLAVLGVHCLDGTFYLLPNPEQTNRIPLQAGSNIPPENLLGLSEHDFTAYSRLPDPIFRDVQCFCAGENLEDGSSLYSSFIIYTLSPLVNYYYHHRHSLDSPSSFHRSLLS